MEAERWEDMRNKIQLKEKDLRGWMDRNKLPKNLKKEIKKKIDQKLEENKDTDLEILFFDIPMKCLRHFLGKELLKKVPKLARMDDSVLKMMCGYLKPVMYAEDAVVLKMGDPLDKMLLITEGTLATYKPTSNDDTTENAETGGTSSCSLEGNIDKESHGAKELIDWATQKKDSSQLPCSGFNVKCSSKVEGFVLMAKDLRSVVSKDESRWKFGISRSDASIEQVDCAQKPGVNP